MSVPATAKAYRLSRKDVLPVFSQAFRQSPPASTGSSETIFANRVLSKSTRLWDWPGPKLDLCGAGCLVGEVDRDGDLDIPGHPSILDQAARNASHGLQTIAERLR